MDDHEFYALLGQALELGFRHLDWAYLPREERRRADKCIEPVLRRIEMELRFREFDLRVGARGANGKGA